MRNSLRISVTADNFREPGSRRRHSSLLIMLRSNRQSGTVIALSGPFISARLLSCLTQTVISRIACILVFSFANGINQTVWFSPFPYANKKTRLYANRAYSLFHCCTLYFVTLTMQGSFRGRSLYRHQSFALILRSGSFHPPAFIIAPSDAKGNMGMHLYCGSPREPGSRKMVSTEKEEATNRPLKHLLHFCNFFGHILSRS